MVQRVLARHVARSAKVKVITLGTLPTDSCDPILPTDVTHDMGMFCSYKKKVNHYSNYHIEGSHACTQHKF